ncbi:putative ATPase [Candidatus Sulfopaludibacter sp. SbA6]|nr:putative ATPase [Candidatus Sulfopaludibacter sp. SbA6]
MSETIKKLTIEGFKSIRKLENFELRPLNILIGANGAGKSNFVGFFRLLRELVEQRLQLAVQTMEGGADRCLYMGPKITRRFTAKLYFGQNGYQFALDPTPDNRLVFAEETTAPVGDWHWDGDIDHFLGFGYAESILKGIKDISRSEAPRYVYEGISSWTVYHFHDTSLTAGVRRQRPINDNEALRPDAENLAAFLYRIRQTSPGSYSRIRDVVGLAAPFFDDFKLRPVPGTPDLIELEWLQKDSDYPFRAHQLSDGTLRFICLATALLQPVRPPTMLFDEPELGLHPYALTLLGNLITRAAEEGTQLIVSTQSAPLLNEFVPEDVIVVERHQGESVFRRLDSSDLSEWLREYTLGALWQKNVLGGGPAPENTPQFVPNGDQRS